MTKGGGGLIPAHAGKTLPSSRRLRRRPAHPRSRGENRRVSQFAIRQEGSSPLTRGKPPAENADPLLTRLIPAHAGKTVRARTAQVLRAAHPRSRGENDGGFAWKAGFPGSSPLTRGKLGRQSVDGHRKRLIPAHAGKTARVPASQRRRQAHPRSRGENGRGSASPTREGGSSPLTRGKQGGSQWLPYGPRLIPAHAGKTPASSDTPRWSKAHPRSRGENRPACSRVIWFAGSSPLTRGKQEANGGLEIDGRLIPAHAGKTPQLSVFSASREAHPRSRGENGRLRCGSCCASGSSPLTRGKHGAAGEALNLRGLIPAHAGKTCPSSRQGLGTQAHPRSRGENRSPSGRSVSTMGSSPLTRGKLLAEQADNLDVRLIPAHAGKTWPMIMRPIASPAHPRSRGENAERFEAISRGRGSSPLTRGKRFRGTR